MTTEYSPRVLRVSFEFHVPKGLRRDVRFSRVESAVDQFVAAVQALTPTVFPWADKLIVDCDWSYRWWDPDSEEIALPSTEDNTVA